MKQNEFIDFKNQQYMQNKMMEILMEKIKTAAEAKNDDIVNAAIDAFTIELINNEVI